MKKRAARTYSDLKGRTTTKSRLRRYDRIPGDQFDADKAIKEKYLNVDDSGPFDAVEEVDPAEVEVVTDLVPMKPDVDNIYDDLAETNTDRANEEEMAMDMEMGYEDGMEIDDDDIEEAYYGDEEPTMGEKPYEDNDDDDDEKEACMLKKSEASFSERLRLAMEGEEDLLGDLGEEVALDDVEVVDETPMGDGPCPAGCEPVVTEAPEGDEQGILEVDEDEVSFLDEEPKEASADEDDEEEDEEDEKEKEASVEDTASFDQPVYETLGDITALGEVGAERVDMVLTNEETSNPQYVVLVDGDPLAKVAFDDQQSMTADHADMFTDPDYPRYVLEGINNFGLEETLKHVHARFYTAQALHGKVAQTMRTAAAQDLEGVHRARLAEMKDHLINTASIVLEGSLKNYITENPLRDELVRLIKSANVHENDALDIVEDAFRSKGGDFFRAVIAKAEEWLGAPQEVLEHHIKEIAGMNYRHPGYSRLDEEMIPEEHTASTYEVPHNVPLRTIASVPQAQTEFTRDQLRKELNLHGLLVQKSLANRKF